MKMNRKIEYINECITFILVGDSTFEFESNYIIIIICVCGTSMAPSASFVFVMHIVHNSKSTHLILA